MEKLPDNDRAIKNCRPKPGQSRTRWMVEGRKGLWVDVSVITPRKEKTSDEAAPPRLGSNNPDFRRVYYFRDRRHEIFERLGDVAHLSLSEAWKAVQSRHAETTLHGPRSTVTITFGELFDDWLKWAKAKPLKSWPHEEEMYERHLKSRMETWVIAQKRKRDFIAVRDDIAKEASAIQADKGIALVGRILNWAERSDRIEDHPARNIPKLGELRSRDRVLTHKEIRSWWRAVGEHTSARVAIVLRLLLLTGLRLSEVTGMTRQELRNDEARGKFWEIPGARTKSGLAHVVPVTGQIEGLITEALTLAEGSQFVFPAISRKGLMLRKPMSRHTPDHAFSGLAIELNFVDADGKPDCAVHDLRRTMATELARLKFSDGLIDRVQGRVRKPKTVTWIYNRYDYFDEKREALQALEREILRIVS